MQKFFRSLAGAWLLVLAAATLVAAGQSSGSIEGVVVDASGARLPGVTVEVVALPRGGKPVAGTVTDADGGYRVSPVRAGEYIVLFGLEGFSKPELRATVAPGTTVTVTATLEIQQLSETVQVVANTLALEADTSTQTTSFSNEALNELPTASRNYTHVIVGGSGRERAAAGSHRRGA